MGTRKRKKEVGPDLMERMRAAVCLCNANPQDDKLSAFAFLSLLHPEIPLATRLRMAHEIKYGKERDRG